MPSPETLKYSRGALRIRIGFPVKGSLKGSISLEGL